MFGSKQPPFDGHQFKKSNSTQADVRGTRYLLGAEHTGEGS